MQELSRGACWSVSLHAAVLGAVWLVSIGIEAFGNRSPGVGLSLGLEGRSGLRGTRGGGSGGPVDVGELERSDPRESSAHKPQVAVSGGARQTSATGPAVLTPEQQRQRRQKLFDERVERIRKTARLQQQSAPRTTASRSSAKALSASDIAARLRNGTSTAGGSGSGGGNGTGTGTGPGRGSGGPGTGDYGDGPGSGTNGVGGGGGGGGDPFYSAISQALYQAWDPPGRQDVGGRRPVVRMKIVLRSDGTITAFQMVKSSGFKVMDDSVLDIFRTLRELPAPASYGITARSRTVEITFNLDE